MSAVIPEFIKAKVVPGGRGHFEDDLPGGPCDFGRHIDDFAAQCCWTGFEGGQPRRTPR